MKKVLQAVLLAGLVAVSAKAQDVPRWELGPTLNLIKVQQALGGDPSFGYGARGVWNFSNTLGADVQFSRNTHNQSQTLTASDQFTANLKATWRGRNVLRVNPFVIAGVGLARDGVTLSLHYPFTGTPYTFNSYQNEFALRFGGGAEFNADKRFSIRFDASDLATRIPDPAAVAFSGLGPPAATWWNRLDVSVALMMHLGAVEKRRQ